MFAVTVSFEINPDFWDRFMPLMLLNARSSLRDEPGCRQFDVCTDPNRKYEVFLYELYDDEKAFEDHLASGHFIEFQAATLGMVVSKDVRSYSRVAQ